MNDRVNNLLLLLSACALPLGCSDRKTQDETGDPETRDEICEAYGIKYAECWDGPFQQMGTQHCFTYIEQTVYYYDEECGSALEDLFVCITSLDCDDFVSHTWEPTCAAELAAYDAVCE